MERLEIEIVYEDVTVQYVSHYAIGTLPLHLDQITIKSKVKNYYQIRPRCEVTEGKSGQGSNFLCDNILFQVYWLTKDTARKGNGSSVYYICVACNPVRWGLPHDFSKIISIVVSPKFQFFFMLHVSGRKKDQ